MAIDAHTICILNKGIEILLEEGAFTRFFSRHCCVVYFIYLLAFCFLFSFFFFLFGKFFSYFTFTNIPSTTALGLCLIFGCLYEKHIWPKLYSLFFFFLSTYNRTYNYVAKMHIENRWQKARYAGAHTTKITIFTFVLICNIFFFSIIWMLATNWIFILPLVSSVSVFLAHSAPGNY